MPATTALDLQAVPTPAGLAALNGSIITTELPDSPKVVVALAWTQLPPSVTVKAGTSASFYHAVAVSWYNDVQGKKRKRKWKREK